MIGKKFGKLTVLEELQERKHGSKVYKCICDCGNIINVRGYSLKNGNTKSCGCLKREHAVILGKDKRTHGKTHSPLYRNWLCMKSRCNNKTDDHYPTYGGRGIVVCDEWLHDFMSFYNWSVNNGYHKGLTIDRIDVNGNYEPNNCRWSTRKQQARNRRSNRNYTINGETHCLSEWCEIYNIKYATVLNRLNKLNWSINQALKLEVR